MEQVKKGGLQLGQASLKCHRIDTNDKNLIQAVRCKVKPVMGYSITAYEWYESWLSRFIYTRLGIRTETAGNHSVIYSRQYQLLNLSCGDSMYENK
jgi:hypothetical protein